MIVTLRDPKIIKTLEPPQVAAYLKSHGWQEQSRDGEKSSIWTRKNEAGEEYEILLPLQPEISGFALRMYEVMSTLEIAENRSQIEILANLITSLPNTTIQGVVMQIYTPNADKVSGEIALLGVVVDRLRKIQTELANHEYILAIKAYQEHLPIVCTGDLIKEKNNFILKKVCDFNLDETWQN
ncbi:hypothetical protein [Argonema antarcticum]|uniref:hypothetical protein n=1 Tax=Argonema antarcticum TaxID=2942763 RepID=UPI002012C484|nr:hypothetical protein [Argonema antarcticum]MCL1474597.1 hypothetical protein [Argonema antarcticum A004/B2]